MSVTFLIALVVALLAIVYWRIVLMIVPAILIAMIVTGISTVIQRSCWSRRANRR